MKRSIGRNLTSCQTPPLPRVCQSFIGVEMKRKQQQQQQKEGEGEPSTKKAKEKNVEKKSFVKETKGKPQKPQAVENESATKKAKEKKSNKPFVKEMKGKKAIEGESSRVSKKPFVKKGVKGGKVDKVSKPPDWSKFKKDKKLARETRRRAGIDPDLLAVIADAKATGEALRRKKAFPAERTAMTDKLHAQLKQKGYYKQIALAHDTSRIIQWILKFGSAQVRREASEALMELVVQMLQSKYARNCVKRILKYGSQPVREKVIDRLNGSVVKLAAHALSAPILDYAYTEVATKVQKCRLRQEFYSDMYKLSKDDNVKKLKDTYQNSPDMKNAILSATKANLLKVLNKNVHDCGLVHAVLFDYLNECNSADKSEMVTTLSPLVAPLSNSKEGVRTAVMCLWHGTNKDKKTILKVLKEHAVSLATHEHGHLLILATLSAVDDTVLVSKALVSVLLKNVKELAKEEWGRKVILWLVAPRNKIYFHPSFVEWLDSGLNKGTSKKPADVKAAELLKEAIPSLSESIQEDTEFWMSNSSICLTTVAILKAVTDTHLKQALTSVAEFVCQTSWKVTEESEEVAGIEHSGIHLCLKKLAQNDKVNVEKNEATFGEAVCAALKDDVIEIWINANRGCFLLITLFENNSQHTQDRLKLILKPSVKKLKKLSTPGAKILLKKIST